MAIHASSTPAPAVHRPPLLPLVPFVFRPTQPVDDPRSAVEILDEIRREIAVQEVSAQTVRKPEVPPEPLSVADVPCGLARHGASPIAIPQEVQGADTLRALHARRALEQALDHGTALLAALGLPRLVKPGFARVDPEVIGDHLDAAIALLDAIDAPEEDIEETGDDEPWLAWVTSPSTGCIDTGISADDRELDTADWEPMLGAPEQHECVISCVGGCWHGVEPDQRRWADGGSHDREQEITDEPHDDQEDEETLGWIANASQLALGPNTADGDLTAPERFGMGFVRCAPDDHEPNGDAEPSLARPEGFQFETGGDLDLERVDEDGTDDGDASHFTGRLQFLARAFRQSEVAHA